MDLFLFLYSLSRTFMCCLHSKNIQKRYENQQNTRGLLLSPSFVCPIVKYANSNLFSSFYWRVDFIWIHFLCEITVVFMMNSLHGVDVFILPFRVDYSKFDWDNFEHTHTLQNYDFFCLFVAQWLMPRERRITKKMYNKKRIRLFYCTSF